MAGFLRRKERGAWLPRGQRGFALVEILVALTILGVVAVGFLSALTSAYGAVIVADRQTKAESATRTEMEYLRNLPYSDNINNPLVAFPQGASPGQPNWHPDQYYGYPYYPDTSYKVQVTSIPINPGSENIAVVIWFQSPRGLRVLDNTTTYRADPNRNF